VPATVAAQLALPLTATLLGVQETAIDVTVDEAVMATLALPDTAGVCVLVAVMVTLPEVGAIAGAV